ncbi:MAG: hypothetical protein Q8P25_00465 [Candidatus Curtissbacteria bacterium]|nr:hypothetical protein [Candidatus Curtissbacteria bacterium]
MSKNVKPQSLKEALQVHNKRAKENLGKRHPHAQRFFQIKGVDLGKIRHHSAKILTAGALAGTLLLGAPGNPTSLKIPPLPAKWVNALTERGWALPEDPQGFLVSHLTEIIPKNPCPLPPEEEKRIGLFIERLTGIRARTSLEGERLNVCYGLIGAEQHLPRFPGDSIWQHDEFQNSGITPGLGAWGYFARSRSELNPLDVQREKYYVAVQTLYLPDWEKRLPYLRDWYKYRKVLVLNPKTGQAVVASIADAGPASWTGKQFGGSPEVMYQLGLGGGPRKGAVLLLFVDDPENKVQLGPVDYAKMDLPRVPVQEI